MWQDRSRVPALGIVGLVVGAIVAVVASDLLARWQVGPHAADAWKGDDPLFLRELAERLLSPTWIPRTHLLPGVLPAELTIDLPLPPGSQVIGSSIRLRVPSPPGGNEVTVVLDVPGEAADVIAFYEQAR